MNKKDLFNKIADTYYNQEKIELKDLTTAIKRIMPVFGEINLEINKTSYGYELRYLDVDIVTHVLRSDKNSNEMIEVELTERESKMYSTTTRIIELDLNMEGEVTSASCGMNGFFTKANKDLVLFVGNLIGKTIINL